MANTYAARKARGLCVFHADTPARPGSVMCADCAAKQHARRAARLTPAERQAKALRRRMRAQRLRLVQALPQPMPVTPLLVCCDTWWQITHIPLVVPCCGRVWFQKTED